MKILLLVLALAGTLLTGCERREKGEPQRAPGEYFHLGTPACGGGDVCIGRN